MKKSKVFFLGMVVMVLAIGLASCGTLNAFGSLSGVETETSKMLLDAANEVLLARESGMSLQVFETAFVRKVPGVQSADLILSENTNFTYEGRTYAMNFSFITQKDSRGTTIKYLTSARRCVDVTKD